MRAIFGVAIVTGGLVIGAAALASIFVLLSLTGSRTVAHYAALGIPMFSGFLPVGAIYLTIKVVDLRMQRVVVPLACVISLAAVPLSSAFAWIGAERYGAVPMSYFGSRMWILVGILFSLLALWEARRLFGILFWRPKQKTR